MAAWRAILLILSLSHVIFGQNDLRSALEAVDRRQRELAEYKANAYDFGPYGGLNDVVFLNNAADGNYRDEDSYGSDRKRSLFREKLEADKERQMEEFAKNMNYNLESNGMPGEFSRNSLKDLWERYYGNDMSYPNEALNKRYHSTYEVKNADNRKRGWRMDGWMDNDEPTYSVHHHVPRGDYSNYIMYYLKNPYSHKKIARSQNVDGFIVAKRSSTYNKEQKRSVKKQTDPQVEKDLSNIFGNDGTSTESPQITLAPKKKIEKKDRPKMEKDINKEVFEPVAPQSKRQLQLSKKSIDWSDYFGLDRRKKSYSNNSLDKEWLMERYHKAIAITARKKKSGRPVASNKDDNSDHIDETDRKLQKLEDKIVDDALKYTGAHQDEEDPKEIQIITENIISQLAQAYNIEKMRNALEEYKTDIEKERQKAQNDKEFRIEEKRVAVPRKEAIDDEVVGAADNNIKCISGSEDCYEQNYKIPSYILDTHYQSASECPAIERACNDVSLIIGHYGFAFKEACSANQMCLLCHNNSWFPPTRACNVLFITKALELCNDKGECKKEAYRSLKYLLEINKSLQTQPTLIDVCELQCPESDN